MTQIPLKDQSAEYVQFLIDIVVAPRGPDSDRASASKQSTGGLPAQHQEIL